MQKEILDLRARLREADAWVSTFIAIESTCSRDNQV
jgi:hypothetical protein